MTRSFPEPIPTIRWQDRTVRVLDQRALPRRETYRTLREPAQLVRAIRSLSVRGAPALGIAGAYGVALAAYRAAERRRDPLRAVRAAGRRLAGARPTALALSEGVQRAQGAVEEAARAGEGPAGLAEAARSSGDRMLEEDLAASRSMAEHGLERIPSGKPVLTHCNTGGLATGGLGTALAVIRLAASRGRIPEVFVDETRPLLQGGRLTLWELRRDGIPARLLPDGAAAWALATQGIGAVLVGADRIAANGDTANKIGTFGLALAARAADVPFFVVAPLATIEPTRTDGGTIPIEERPPGEVSAASGWPARAAVRAFNPAFDVTPAALIAGWITEGGLLRPPLSRPAQGA